MKYSYQNIRERGGGGDATFANSQQQPIDHPPGVNREKFRMEYAPERNCKPFAVSCRSDKAIGRLLPQLASRSGRVQKLFALHSSATGFQ